MRVLIAEDDAPLAEGLASLLTRNGFVCDTAASGSRADFLMRTESYDAAVLDLGLPMRDGLSLLRDWRDNGFTMPVLILTARSRWPDKAAGFAAGADDFVTKPFEPLEVVMRLQALVRRSRGVAQTTVAVGPVSIDTAMAQVTVNGQPVSLTAQEYRLFIYLVMARDRVVSRSELREHAYERDRDPDSNVIDVLVGRVRRKLGVELIETVRGMGFVVRSGGAGES